MKTRADETEVQERTASRASETSFFPSGKSTFSLRRSGQGNGKVFLSRLDWSIAMHRVFFALLDKGEFQDKGKLQADAPFSICRVRVQQIRSMAHVCQKSIYEEVVEATTWLAREPIGIWDADEKSYEGFPIFSACKYDSEDGAVEARFNEDARPYLHRLQKHFRQHQLRQAVPLPTPYAIRTYEIGKMIEQSEEQRVKRMPVGQFRQMFGLEDKYERHSDMRRRVIDPSVEQVNEKTDVDVRCRDVRDGQTPVALQWTVESTETAEEDDKEVPGFR